MIMRALVFCGKRKIIYLFFMCEESAPVSFIQSISNDVFLVRSTHDFDSDPSRLVRLMATESAFHRPSGSFSILVFNLNL